MAGQEFVAGGNGRRQDGQALSRPKPADQGSQIRGTGNPPKSGDEKADDRGAEFAYILRGVKDQCLLPGSPSSRGLYNIPPHREIAAALWLNPCAYGTRRT